MTRTRTVQVPNAQGMHARPSAEFVKLASGFSSSIQVAKNDLEVNAKSIMGVLMLAAEQGSALTIRAEGEDADRAVEALARLVRRGFDE
ncbi:MAG: HPr family phosphocarrier protein [Gemmatimonadetes bacterium]|nr:HPr family phosphocarrier protein [Gemmatimonadota bacterium]MDE2678898.1 HPr family phosphocarrier protein [Gemmatimonadota bacterium]MXX35943.1 HPr family phosphocarrier protein [Gemmatimonadota bacterium]MYA10487.1 HPr family phosphocarrier protein [Gemmatimonadota bacterium]MYD13572.1 HPr family phosphocarrier protein [Gemmatimonadota bacterium]